MLGTVLARVFELAQPQADKLRLSDFRHHVDQLLLHELIASQGARELLARFDIIKGAEVAGASGADRTPRDPVPGLGKACQRSLESPCRRQMARSVEPHVVKK